MDDTDRKTLEPLLGSAHSEIASEIHGSDGSPLDLNYGSTIEEGPAFTIPESRKIGVTGAVFLILNKMIGSGSEFPWHSPRLNLPADGIPVFSTPSSVFASTGSVGVSLLMWAVGA